MNKSLSGECRECGARLEFPAEAVGTAANCPYCGKPTELRLELPLPERTVPTKTIIYAVIAILILVGGLIAALMALRRAELERAERVKVRNSATPFVAPKPPQNK